MFDPTIYDNLKVVIEGAVYDLDFDGKMIVIDRSNLVDLAKMSREYHVLLKENKGHTQAKIILRVTTQSLASEILETQAIEELGCDLIIQFSLPIKNIDNDCETIKFLLARTWRKYRPQIKQELSFVYGQQSYYNTITLSFLEQINEDDIDNLPDLIDDINQTVHSLNTYIS